MKRFHVHISVNDLGESIGFYSKLFGATPDVEKPDYAKWMLDDPRVNFAISQRGHAAGVDHLGFQVDSDDELKLLRRDVDAAGLAALDQAQATCCYAASNKHWIQDPQGVAWETFHTLGSALVFGDDDVPGQANDGACCVPPAMPANTAEKSACCAPPQAVPESTKKCCG